MRRVRNPAFAEGIRQGVGPAAAIFVLALSYGAAAKTAGWGVALPLMFSLLAFSGSAQFALLTTVSAGSALTAVAGASLINARYMVMSVAVNDSLRGGRLRRALQAQAIVDPSFVMAHRGNGRFDIARLVGATLPQWTCWVGGTAVGLLAGPSPQAMHDFGVDAVFPAFFLLLAVDEVRGSGRALLGAVLGAGIAGALLFVAEPGNALLGATAGAVVGALPGAERSTHRGGES